MRLRVRMRRLRVCLRLCGRRARGVQQKGFKSESKTDKELKDRLK